MSSTNPICGFTLRQRAEVAASLFGASIPLEREITDKGRPRQSWSILSVRDLVVWFMSLPFKNGRKPTQMQIGRILGLNKSTVGYALARVRAWVDGMYSESLIIGRIYARDSSRLPITQTLSIYRDLRRSTWRRGFATHQTKGIK